MRRSKKEKQQTHTRIVEGAARMFRMEGFQGASIVDLMEYVGLTHGGFYAHFPNKEALLAEVCIQGLAQTQEQLVETAKRAPADEAVSAILNAYLTTFHRDHPASGCIIPTLGAEIARRPEEVRIAFTQACSQFLEHLAPFLPEHASQSQEDESLVFLAGLVGTLLLARAVNDPVLSERLLDANRLFYQQAFSRQQPDQRNPPD